ncbi:hypothetical protein FYJ29_07940 [Bacteroidales bacterium Oil-RF-744-WCA-WT-10]|uniref:Uncharacterized protein n=1 Tax=Sodaliphilus pleomorphus TaxID=2606626 RepID=A0A6L5XE53_9BACT|nr:hypothetical protein [Sodaliphilus pleomorphus]
MSTPLKNSEELKHNGYVLCKGKSLKEFKLQFAHLINEASKTTQDVNYIPAAITEENYVCL